MKMKFNFKKCFLNCFLINSLLLNERPFLLTKSAAMPVWMSLVTLSSTKLKYEEEVLSN